jgi:solute carrier family 25 citrate transporter 1
MPLDTVKTQLQLNSNRSLGATVTGIQRANGIGGFYSGFGAMVTQVGGKAAIRFLSFEQAKLMLGQLPQGSLSPVQTDFVSGMLAGVIEAGVWVCPTERVKVLQQATACDGGARASTLATAAKLYGEQGVRGFFVGFGATALRQGSAMGLRFAMYSQVKAQFGNTFGKGPDASVPVPLQLLLAGMTTGALSAVANQPIDTAKSVIQSSVKQGSGDDGVPRSTGTLDCLRKLYAKGGINAWYAGSTPRVLRLTIGQGVIFSCQDQISSLLHNIAGY